MPHADHFLSRLDRLNTSEVDTALQLYRDPDLLREIMAAAKVPEVVPRVALSLDDPVLGPFIVVTRDGHFVTCLGKGMHATGLHVITRGQLDAFAEKIETLRERLELGKRFIGNSERPLLQLLRRLAEHPDCIGREEFLAISAWEPMLAKVFLDFYFAANYEIMTQTPGLCRVRHFKGKSGEESLRQYWSLIHTAGHLIILATMGSGGDYFFEVTEDHLATRGAMAWSLTQTASLPFIMRGAWAVGRVGKCLLPAYKKALGERALFSDLLDTVFGLIAIGRRHAGLRAEIVKALHATQTAPRTQTAELLRSAKPREFTLACRLGIQMTECADDELEEALLDQGQAVLGNRGRDLPEELLRDVVRVAPLHDYSNGLGDSKSLANTALLVAATARDAPERFYYPQSLARDWRVRWEPKHTLALLELNKQQLRVLRPPARRKDVPRRNEACPCGSGKKYKRCCGAD